MSEIFGSWNIWVILAVTIVSFALFAKAIRMRGDHDSKAGGVAVNSGLCILGVGVIVMSMIGIAYLSASYTSHVAKVIFGG